MAKLTKDQVLKLAALSRLQLTEDEVVQFQDELSSILEYVEQLESVDVTGLKPATQVGGLQDVMRPDEVVSYQAQPEELRKVPPQSEGNYIKVGRMIG